MGFWDLWNKVFGSPFKKKYRVVLTGLDGAGKTSVLFKLRLGEIISSYPFIGESILLKLIQSGFAVQTVEYKGITFHIWDIDPKQDSHREIWRPYVEDANAVIFMIDGNDREGFPEARQQLHKLIYDDDARNFILLIFANKLDLPNAMSSHEITDKLGLHQIKNRKWFLQPSCAVTGDGLYVLWIIVNTDNVRYEGFDWLSKTVTC